MGNTALQRMDNTEVLIADDSVEQRWEKVRSYSENAVKLAKGMVWCQIMAGLELAALKKSMRVTQGKRTDLANFPNGLGSWEAAVKEFAGISDETARNWMKMADSLKERLKKLPAKELLSELMALPPSQWSIEQEAMVTSFVKGAADGRTQLDFLCEFDMAKKAKLKGGAREQKGKKLTPSEELAEARRLAESDWAEDEQALDAYAAKFTLLDDTLVQAQCATLERLLQARLMWLRQPQTKRDPEAIEKFLKEEMI